MYCDESDADVILRVEEKEFSCHRAILAKKSPYFQAMFGDHFVEREKQTIHIQGVEPEALEILISYAYRNDFEISPENVFSLLQAAAMLQFDSIQRACIKYIIQSLTVGNCLPTVSLADQLGLSELYFKARRVALWEFSDVRKTERFLELGLDFLMKYLSDDGLRVQNEVEVFESVQDWVEDCNEGRTRHLSKLLECVRFSYIDIMDMQTCLCSPMVSRNSEIFHLLECIIDLKKKQASVVSNNIDQINSQESSSSSSLKRKMSDDTNFCCCTNFGCNVKDKVQEQFQQYSRREESSHSRNSIEPSEGKGEKYSPELLSRAKFLLDNRPRVLPLTPCVVGHIRDEVEHRSSSKEADTCGEKGEQTGRKRKEEKKSRAFVLAFDTEEKTITPFLNLSKIHQGPLEATGYKVCAVGKDIYLVGGEYMLGHSNWNKTVWRFDTFKETWHYEASLPHSRRHHSMCVLDEYIYLIGGFGKHRVILDKVERYDTTDGEWGFLSPLPNPMYAAACCSHKGLLYVIGSQVYTYHPLANSWTTCQDICLPNNVGFSSAMSYGDWIYLTGSYRQELMRFCPDMTLDGDKKQTPESVGSFKNRSQNTCLIGDKIYSFCCEDDQLCVESYSITEGRFKIEWTAYNHEVVKDFSPNYCLGCFPLIRYK